MYCWWVHFPFGCWQSYSVCAWQLWLTVVPANGCWTKRILLTAPGLSTASVPFRASLYELPDKKTRPKLWSPESRCQAEQPSCKKNICALLPFHQIKEETGRYEVASPPHTEYSIFSLHTSHDFKYHIMYDITWAKFAWRVEGELHWADNAELSFN